MSEGPSPSPPPHSLDRQMAGSSLRFVITPRIAEAVEYLSHASEGLNRQEDLEFLTELAEQVSRGRPAAEAFLAEGDAAQPDSLQTQELSVTLSQIHRLSEIGLAYKKRLPRKNGDGGEDAKSATEEKKKCPSFYLQDLLHEGRPLPHLNYAELRRREELSKPDPEIVEYLNSLRQKQTRRELEELLGNGGVHGRDGVGPALRDMHMQAGMGINMILLMITGFIVCWWLGKKLFGSEKDPSGIGGVGAVLSGLAGMIGVMIVEMSLFVIREQRKINREAAREEALLERAKQRAREYRATHTPSMGKTTDLGDASISDASS